MNTFPYNNKSKLDNIDLGKPYNISHDTFFSKILNNKEEFYLQTPKCSIKNGIIKTSKKKYLDLVFTVENNGDFIEFFENLQSYLEEKIYENKDVWFQSDIDKDDIHYFFQNPMKKYKKHQMIIRTFIKNELLGSDNLVIFRKNGDKVDESILEDKDKNYTFIFLLELTGVRFTSTNFHLDIYVKQSVIIDDDPLENKCFIQLKETQLKETQLKETMENSTNLENEDLSNPKSTIEAELPDKSLINEAEPETEPKTEPETEPKTEPKTNNETNDELKNDNAIQDINHRFTQSTSNNKTENKNESVEESVEESVYEIVDKNENNGNKGNENNETENNKNNSKIEEIDLEDDEINDDIMNLRKPNEIYYEMYKNARDKAKKLKEQTIEAYLIAQQIRDTYLLEEFDKSDIESIVSMDDIDEMDDLEDI